jgi:lipopolysaccharide export system permease protein
MGTIDRLILRDVLKTLLVVVAIVLLLFFSNAMVKFLGRAASGALGPELVLSVVGFEMIKAASLMIPPALFFSILWVLGRMHRDSEMVALAAGGYGSLRQFRAVLLVAMPLAALVAVLVMHLLPWAQGQLAKIKAEQSMSADIGAIRPGRFNEFNRGRLVIYAGQVAEDGSDGLRDVFVQDVQHDRTGLVMAAGATQLTDPESGASYVVLADGQRYETGRDGLDYTVGRFDTYAIRIPELDVVERALPRSARDWRALLGSGDPRDWAELNYRLSIPLSVVAFAVLAVPLARTAPRAGVYGRLVFAVLLYFLFMNLQQFAEELLADGRLPGWLGLWWLPVLMVMTALLVMWADSNWLNARLRALRRGGTR